MADGQVPASYGRRRLRRVSIAVPLAGLVLLYPLRLLLLRSWPAPVADGLVGLLMLVGVLTFSWVIFRLLARQDAQLVRRHTELARRYQTECRLRDQLVGVEQAAIAIASALSSAEILQRLVELAREIVPARYAALGVLGPQEAIDAFYTAGLSAEARSRLGPPPQGHGLLSVTLTEGRAVRIGEISQDPRHVGFPPGHPEMHCLLAVPILLAGRISGNLYLADKENGAFTAEDERLLTLIAGHAAVALEQARLTEQVRRLAASSERERIRIALQDSAIQTLYAVNLDLELALADLDQAPSAVGARIDRAMTRVDTAMEDIRRCILGNELPERAASEATATEREETCAWYPRDVGRRS